MTLNSPRQLSSQSPSMRPINSNLLDSSIKTAPPLAEAPPTTLPQLTTGRTGITDASTDIADLTGNSITVANVAAPALTSASYDASTGALVITGSPSPAYPGANNDLDVSALSITGEGGNSYALTSDDVELSSSTSATVSLNSTDQSQLASLLHKNGTSSGGGTTYNIAAANRWVPRRRSMSTAPHLTGNGIGRQCPKHLELQQRLPRRTDCCGLSMAMASSVMAHQAMRQPRPI